MDSQVRVRLLLLGKDFVYLGDPASRFGLRSEITLHLELVVVLSQLLLFTVACAMKT